jgi:hypothetical protein
LAPNWTIVGGWGPLVDIVKSGESGTVQYLEGRRAPTAVSCKLISVEFLGQDHGRVAEIGAVGIDCLAEGELLVVRVDF